MSSNLVTCYCGWIYDPDEVDSVVRDDVKLAEWVKLHKENTHVEAFSCFLFERIQLKRDVLRLQRELDSVKTKYKITATNYKELRKHAKNLVEFLERPNVYNNILIGVADLEEDVEDEFNSLVGFLKNEIDAANEATRTGYIKEAEDMIDTLLHGDIVLFWNDVEQCSRESLEIMSGTLKELQVVVDKEPVSAKSVEARSKVLSGFEAIARENRKRAKDKVLDELQQAAPGANEFLQNLNKDKLQQRTDFLLKRDK